MKKKRKEEIFKKILKNISDNTFEETKNLIKELGDINFKSGNDTRTIWSTACWIGNQKLAKFCLENKVDVNAQDDHGNTALSWAIMNNKSEMCRFLLNKGASLEIKNFIDKTPLDFIKTGTVTLRILLKLKKKQQLKN